MRSNIVSKQRNLKSQKVLYSMKKASYKIIPICSSIFSVTFVRPKPVLHVNFLLHLAGTHRRLIRPTADRENPQHKIPTNYCVP